MDMAFISFKVLKKISKATPKKIKCQFIFKNAKFCIENSKMAVE